jgi:hypothetical protein
MIKKFKLFEQDRNKIDPYGEEIWEELNGFDIQKVALKDGGFYYFSSYHNDANPVNKEGGIIQFRFQGTKACDYLMAVGECFEKGYSFEFFPLPDWDFIPLNEEEKKLVMDDKIGIKVYVCDWQGEGDFQDLKFSDILKIFKISKEDFIMCQSPLNEYSDYRNVTGYGSMGHSDQQNAGPSFNKGPDSATFRRPDVIGVASDVIEDPYFAGSRRARIKKIKKNKNIENNRKKKTRYFNSLEKDTLRDKIMEDFVIKEIDIFKKIKTDEISRPEEGIISWEEVFKIHDYNKRKYLNDNKFKIFENQNDLDPYGEENWNEDKEKEEFDRGILDYLDDRDRELDYTHCRICGERYPYALMLDQVCPDCREDM